MKHYGSVLLILLAISLRVFGQTPEGAAAKPPPAPPQKPLSAPFEVVVPVAPTAFKAGGKTHLVYELHATNFSRSDCARVAVGQKPLVISPPLRGGEWLAGNGPSNTSGHRRAMIPVDGRAHIAQRFAIDWVRLREEGRTFTGDPKDNKNYRCF